MKRKIALVGNPNCGKTTLFNALTGEVAHVGNWPGVTVEHKEGKLKADDGIMVIDLPGVYSLSPYSPEEVVARDYLIDEQPDVILNIIDGTNLERSLYLTTQLSELSIPMVVALNMSDLLAKNNKQLDLDELAADLNCPVIPISALRGTGVEELSSALRTGIFTARSAAPVHRYSAPVEHALAHIEDLAADNIPADKQRWYALKLFEGDEAIAQKCNITSAQQESIQAEIDAVERELDDDAESIIAGERYDFIAGIVTGMGAQQSAEAKLSTSDKIDRVVTNRFLALPIFIVTMFLVYFISVTTVGQVATDWANDGVFGDGWFMSYEEPEAYSEAKGAHEEAQGAIEAYNAAAEEAGIEPPAEDATEEDVAKFLKEAAAAGVVTKYISYDDEAGESSETPVYATPEQAVAAGVLAADEGEAATEGEATEGTEASAGDAGEATEGDSAQVEEAGAEEEEDGPLTYAEALEVPEPEPSEYGLWIPGIPSLIEGLLNALQVDPESFVWALIMDGIVAGVGAVLGFVPQILVLFFLLGLLELCGYMARVAFILDRIFRRFGLSGKSFIPLLIGTGCGVPGILASRTIEDLASRRMTIMTTTFMPCGAKLPVIALFAGAIFGGEWWVAPSCYFLGIATVLISGIILKKTAPFAGTTAPFVMELPSYHWPPIKSVLSSMWERAWAFIKKACTILLLACIAIWFLSSYGFENGAFGAVEDASGSVLAIIGSALAFLFIPLGWGDWPAVAGTLSGFLAKEELVATFAILYTSGDSANWFVNFSQAFTPAAAYSLLAFNLLCMPCFAAVTAIAREMNSPKWTLAAVGYEFLVAYLVALWIFQFVGLATGVVAFSGWTVIAGLTLAAVIFLLVRPAKKSVNQEKGE